MLPPISEYSGAEVVHFAKRPTTRRSCIRDAHSGIPGFRRIIYIFIEYKGSPPPGLKALV